MQMQLKSHKYSTYARLLETGDKFSEKDFPEVTYEVRKVVIPDNQDYCKVFVVGLHRSLVFRWMDRVVLPDGKPRRKAE